MFKHAMIVSLSVTWLMAAEPETGVPSGSATSSAARQMRHLTFTTGTVTVGQNLATIVLPEDSRFLAADDARFWVEKVWKNPPDPDIIGMVVPDDLANWYTAKENQTQADPPARTWGLIVSWGGDTGHVEDSDARSTDFAALLKEMQEGVQAANPDRLQAGYGSLELLGWAEPPHYDSETKKLYWAKSLRFNGEKDPTLNYCIRVLGARGVLELNAVDSVDALPQVTEVAKKILTSTELTKGNRYEDFKSGVDPVAAGGIAALIGGGLIAKKIGIFALFGVFILKFIKFLVIPLIVVGAWIMKKTRGS